MINAIRNGYSSGIPQSAPAYVPEINEQPVDGLDALSKSRKFGKKGIAGYDDSFEDASMFYGVIRYPDGRTHEFGGGVIKAASASDVGAAEQRSRDLLGEKVNGEYAAQQLSDVNVSQDAASKVAQLEADLAAKMYTFIRA
jgi:hypothetical protein